MVYEHSGAGSSEPPVDPNDPRQPRGVPQDPARGACRGRNGKI